MAKNKCEICGGDVNLLQQQKLIRFPAPRDAPAPLTISINCSAFKKQSAT